jgi:hypothetical protein
MAKPWKEVEASAKYKALTPEKQAQAKQMYFETVVMKKPEFGQLAPERQEKARAMFLGEPKKVEAPVMEEPQPSMPFTQTGDMRISDLVTSRLGSRLLGTPEGMSAGEQFKQMYDRSQDTNMPYPARFANSFATGVAGDVADMALNPMTYAAAPAIKLGAKAIGATGKLIGKGISKVNPFYTKAEKVALSNIESQSGVVQKSIKFIGDKTAQLKSQLSALKDVYKQKVADMSYKGAKNIEDGIEKSFDAAKQNYGRVINNLKGEKVPLSEAKNIIDEVINVKGIKNKTILSDAEKQLLELQAKIDKKFTQTVQLPEGATGTADVNPLLSLDEVKNFKNIVRSGVNGEPHLEATFYKNYGEMLQRNGLKELDDATNLYREAYKNVDEARLLKRARIKNVAEGKIRKGTAEFKDLADAESKYGLRSTMDAADAFEQFQQQKNQITRGVEGLRGQKLNMEDMIAQAQLQRKAIEAARAGRMKNFNIAAATASGLGLGTGGIASIIRALKGRQ